MGRTTDLTGQTFGDLIVTEYAGKIGTARYYYCECRCGMETLNNQYHLLNGRSKSCGCHRKKAAQMNSIQHGGTMNGKPSTEYNAWQGIRKSLHVDEWSDFNKFFNDMGRRPSEQHQIARRDVRQPHSPTNTYWRNHNEERQASIERPPILDLRSIIRAEIAARQGEESAQGLSRVAAA